MVIWNISNEKFNTISLFNKASNIYNVNITIDYLSPKRISHTRTHILTLSVTIMEYVTFDCVKVEVHSSK